METTIQKPKTTPKDFFLNLGAIAILYFLVINLIQLVFQAIDFAFPRVPEAAGYIPDVSFRRGGGDRGRSHYSPHGISSRGRDYRRIYAENPCRACARRYHLWLLSF